ncbi:DNA-O6-methylguanine--protein-cysteine S-methyltransferase /transcriptional regulator Ada [Crenobacter luteus]|uniref:methylated-DNA--[protein]-cysteine S-methyltransferase n=1 Tax=Crenobacter luteus TaxID=1452487 RepID=UPI0010444297|nr:methylated-DNA--[protein]-cysteine S-methyltransferase [Crenobacter luteus]TCP11371.1 DNA-O6-methylguanine--protein-cysteine S-methyltransferase /transcriptional regulator Ada [Crenobacter luteus]
MPCLPAQPPFPPEAADARGYRRVADAIVWLMRHAERQPTLAELAAALSVSESLLQREFTRLAGVSPKRFLQHLTVTAAKASLSGPGALLDHAYALGLSGGGRLYDHFVTLEAMTPGEYRDGGAGLALVWGVHDTAFGAALVAQSPRGVCLVHFLADGEAPGALLGQRWPKAAVRHDAAATAAVAARLFRPLAEPGAAPLALRVQGSNFQVQVWRALLALPYGALASYGQLAAAIGRPGAARAVGGAVGANPVACLIPCHRVIRAEGALSGYRWGAERKAGLIGWEAAHCLAAEVPDHA